jgi:queuine/archaeosine tRNA-ribosyltransferase
MGLKHHADDQLIARGVNMFDPAHRVARSGTAFTHGARSMRRRAMRG